ncbi:MAG TPA: EAL domain-containing protein [Acidobacteriaceae bacterium]|jgi:diguanylate cyclase (GGDEF)-like protein|nr:EAL domain-containing protein [Acidobacteriaceae bacterium]
MRLPGSGSFAHRMTLLALLTSSIVSITLMAAFLGYDSVSARTQMQNRLASLADIVGQNSAAALVFDDPAAAVEVLHALGAENSVVSACLYQSAGHLFAQYEQQEGVRTCPARMQDEPERNPGFLRVRRTIARRGDLAGTLFLQSDLREIEQRWRHLLQVTGWLLLVSLLVGGVAGSLLQRRISRPVGLLAAAMRRVTEHQDFSARVQPSGCDEITRLGTGFNSMLQELERQASEKRAFAAQLQHQALNDDLTGLPNRRLLSDRLNHALAVARRQQLQVALVYIDLDGFKLVNDSLGHAIGDLLLRQVANRLQSRVRRSDTLARLGGDEFAVVLTEASAGNDAAQVATALLDALTLPFIVEDHEIAISASIGISLFPENGATPMLLLQQADSAMYAAKKLGKSRTVYFSAELGASLRERLHLENQLRSALANGEIVVWYQPEFDIASRRLIRFEALARWKHPVLGMIAPGKFIPIAEETGLIVPLGRHVLEAACREAMRWQSAGPEAVQVAVNVSSLQLIRDNFVEEVSTILEKTGLPAGLLQLELTESVMLSGVQGAAATMQRLADLGISLAIDDFGTGYSCLSYLPQLPFDALKIDRSFVSELGARPATEALVDSLVILAHKLGMRVIAEGIETEQQLERIAAIGTNEAQGYLLGKPTPEPLAFLTAQLAERIRIDCNAVPGDLLRLEELPALS